jgi:predicted kinase
MGSHGNTKIIMLKSLPAAGKTSWAKEYQKNHPGTKRVNKDDLRSMLDNSEWSKSNEKFVIRMRDTVVCEALSAGIDVIVDDTNLDSKHEARLRELAERFNCEFELKFFDVDLDECIRRDAKRSNPVGSKVIIGMYNRYLRPEPKIVLHNPELPWCILVDVDGTLAEKGDRDIYDDSKLHLDTVIHEVRDLVNELRPTTHIFVMSGRQDSCKEQTEEWLCENGVAYEDIFMRKAGDKRCDSIVKKELYEQNIKGKYNVRFVIDDRKRVKRMWVQEGLFTLDVNQHDIEF